MLVQHLTSRGQKWASAEGARKASAEAVVSRKAAAWQAAWQAAAWQAAAWQAAAWQVAERTSSKSSPLRMSMSQKDTVCTVALASPPCGLTVPLSCIKDCSPKKPLVVSVAT